MVDITSIPDGDLNWGAKMRTNLTNLKLGIEAAYTKPGSGIPLSDLAASVIASIGKADSAVQSAGLTKAAVGLANVDNTSDANKPVSTAQANAIALKYTKPTTGIPEADLSSSVQSKLNGGTGGGGAGYDQTARDAAAAAQTTANSKSRTWPPAATPPTSGMSAQDSFYRTDGVLFVYNGTAWVKSQQATERYVQSRGTNLVTNGSFLLGDNTNWSAYAFDASDHPVGAGGMITATATASGFNDELLPVDPAQTYEYSFYAKQLTGGGNFYSAVAPYDADGSSISPPMYTAKTGTITTLGAALNPGDTTVTLSTSANWSDANANVSLRYLAVGGYVDAKGYAWPAGVYTRNFYQYASISGNVVTLNAPYTGPARAAGTGVWNSFAAGSYLYPHTNLVTPTEWTYFSGRFGGVTPAGASSSNTLPRPTSYIKVGFLSNYAPITAPAKVGYSGMSVTNVTAAASAQTSADSKYTKPTSGIPASDLATAVQTSLGKADAALPASAAGNGSVFFKNGAGAVGGLPYAGSATADSLALRVAGGALNVGTPTVDGHAATKAYVDSAVSGAGGSVTSVAGRTGAVTLTKSDVGLANVDNTSDSAKPVSIATATAIANRAPQNLYGTYAARPTSSSVPDGTIYYTSDTYESFRSTGSVWRVIGSGGNELGYAERTSTLAVTTGSGVADVTGVTISFVMPERPVLLQFGSLAQYVGTAAQPVIQVFETTTATPALTAEGFIGQSANGNEYEQGYFQRRITGTAGQTRTFKLSAIRTVGYSLIASATYPIFLGAYTA